MKVVLLTLIIFAVAAFFRLSHLDQIEFKYDEAYTVFQMTQFYQSPYLMQVGPPQSTGVYNFPLFNYLMIWLSLFSRNPMYLSFLIGLINSIFIAIFYLLFKKTLDNTPAFLASLFLAVAPWSILFSRKIWIPDLMFPFAFFCVYYLIKLVVKRESKAVFALGLFSTLLVQTHASGAFFTAITAGILLIFRLKLNYRLLLKGVLIGLVPAVPYLIRQLTSTPFCIDCVALFSYGGGIRQFDLMNFIRPWDFYSGLSFPIPLGESYSEFLKMFPIIYRLNLFYYLEYILLLVGLLAVLKYQRKYLFLLIYPLVLSVLYFLTKTPAIMHYFVVLIPGLFVLLAAEIKSALSFSKNRLYRIGLIGLISVFLLGSFTFNLLFQQFIQAKQKIKGDYGPVYSLTEKYISTQLQDYFLLPNYEELKSYAFMFAQSPNFHKFIADYFLQKGQMQMYKNELSKI